MSQRGKERGGKAVQETKWKGNEIPGETDEEARIQSRGYEKGKSNELKTLIKTCYKCVIQK